MIVKGTDNTGKPMGEIPQTEAGDVAETTVRLKPGKYHLYCDIASHEAQGMKQKFTVTG